MNNKKRYHPRGLSILYEDHDILVVDKISGLLTVCLKLICLQVGKIRSESIFRKKVVL